MSTLESYERMKAKAKARYHSDPEFRAKRIEYAKARQKRLLSDPEMKEVIYRKMRAYAQKYYYEKKEEKERLKLGLTS